MPAARRPAVLEPVQTTRRARRAAGRNPFPHRASRHRGVPDARFSRAYGSVGIVAILLASGCASEAPQTVLDASGQSDLSANELVDHLDALPLDERPASMASVRYDELHIIAEDGSEHTMPLEDGLFYLSFAPYVDHTHDCYFHSLTTCVGELQEQDIDVVITGADGEVLIDETMTTFPNGFAGVWLPSDIEAEISLSNDDGSVTAPISTHEGAPTCVTTLQLEGAGSPAAG